MFALRIVQSLFYLNPKFQASSHLLCMYIPVCVGPGRKPRRPVFSQRGLTVFQASCQSSAAHSNIPSTVTPDSTLGTAAPSSIFSPCTTDTECSTISDAECRHGKCQCVPGLSYDPSTNKCISGKFSVQYFSFFFLLN